MRILHSQMSSATSTAFEQEKPVCLHARTDPIAVLVLLETARRLR